MQSPRVLFPLLLGLLLVVGGCVSVPSAGPPPPPDWVNAPYAHPDCDRRESLCAVGIAPGTGAASRDRARERGLEQIVSSILVSVQSTIRIDRTSRQSRDEAFWTEDLTEHLQVDTEKEVLPGVEVVELWTDPGQQETFTLVTVHRKQLLDHWLPQVDRELGESSGLLASSIEQEPRDPSRAIRTGLEAYRLVSEAYSAAVKSNVITLGTRHEQAGDDAFVRASTRLAECSTHLARLLGNVRVRTLTGDGQQGHVHAALGELLRIRLEYDAGSGAPRPLADLPVRFTTRPPSAAEFASSASNTDARGELQCQVVELYATGLAANEIVVAPDFQSIAPALPDAHVPSERFTYHLPIPSQTRLVVALEETYDDRPFAAPFLADDLAAHLSGLGFVARTVDDAGRYQDLAPAALRQRLGPDIDYVLRGRARSWYSSYESRLHWFRAAAQMEIVDLRTGEIRSLRAGEEKDAHLEHDEAGAVRAMRALKPAVHARIEAVFVADFVAPTQP